MLRLHKERPRNDGAEAGAKGVFFALHGAGAQFLSGKAMRIVTGLTSHSGKSGLLSRSNGTRTGPGHELAEQAWQRKTGGAAPLWRTDGMLPRARPPRAAGRRSLRHRRPESAPETDPHGETPAAARAGCRADRDDLAGAVGHRLARGGDRRADLWRYRLVFLRTAARCHRPDRRPRAGVGHHAGPQRRGLCLARGNLRRHGHGGQRLALAARRGGGDRGQAVLLAFRHLAARHRQRDPHQPVRGARGVRGQRRVDHHPADGQASVPGVEWDPKQWKSEADYEKDCRQGGMWRKIKEVPFAMAMEAKYSKEEILTIYFNRAYLGAGARGFEAAAQRYFGKSAKDVGGRGGDAGGPAEGALDLCAHRQHGARAQPRGGGDRPDGGAGLPDQGRGGRRAGQSGGAVEGGGRSPGAISPTG
jgi:hypothetical protein